MEKRVGNDSLFLKNSRRIFGGFTLAATRSCWQLNEKKQKRTGMSELDPIQRSKALLGMKIA